MNKIVEYFLLIVLLLTLSNCGDPNYYENKKMYSEIINLYPKSLVNHFPNYTYGNIMSLQLMYPRGKYMNGIFIVKRLSKKETQNFQDSVKHIALYSLPFKENLLPVSVKYIPLAYQNTLQFVKTNKSSHKLIPIPGFEFVEETGLSHNFKSNAIIYVIGCEHGKFLKDDYLSDDNSIKIREWSHGYSKGVVIYQKYVIFWLEVW